MEFKFKVGDRVISIDGRSGTVIGNYETLLHTPGNMIVFDNEPLVSRRWYESGLSSESDSVTQEQIENMRVGLILLARVHGT